MLKCSVTPYDLQFAFTARTSRETFSSKRTYFVSVFDDANPGCKGRGEVAVFPSLQPSYKSEREFEALLQYVAENIDFICQSGSWPQNSAIRFGFETALADLRHGGEGLTHNHTVLDNIANGIPINGLVWMDSIERMLEQARKKAESGFRCIKIKIGATDFETELEMLRAFRSEFGSLDIILRLDANGAFTTTNVMSRLDRLARYDIHSIEQPLPRDSKAMAEVCRFSPIPVALDEDMIERWLSTEQKYEFLRRTAPAHIIVKPSLIGGFRSADEWIDIAEDLGIGWWATSALESNVGLSAIAQWLATRTGATDRHHGLGTGNIYTNNIPSRVRLVGERIFVAQ